MRSARFSLPFPVLVAAALLACACGAGVTPTIAPSADDGAALSPLVGDDAASDDASAWSTSSWEAGLSPDDDGPSSYGPETSTPPPSGAPDDACAAPPGPGDLVVDELMIESVAGAGDYGEWLEVASTRDCALDLRGLHAECPSGAKVRALDVVDHLWLPPRATFVVADSADPVIDHDLPGLVLAWSGSPGDVLRNKGGTITLQLGAVLLDALTFPALKLVVGASVAFPSSCPPPGRLDFGNWQTSTRSWFPGFEGTPNAPNDDVQCP